VIRLTATSRRAALGAVIFKKSKKHHTMNQGWHEKTIGLNRWFFESFRFFGFDVIHPSSITSLKENPQKTNVFLGFLLKSALQVIQHKCCESSLDGRTLNRFYFILSVDRK
jgi:hypothetical protein